MTDFQQKINLNPARGWHGDFSSTNPRTTVVDTRAIGGGDVAMAGAQGVLTGSFVWFDKTTRTYNNTGTGSPIGFVGREIIGTNYGRDLCSRLLPAGTMLTVYQSAGFIVNVPDAATPEYGDSVYASTKTGEIVDKSDVDSVQTSYRYEQAKGDDGMAAISVFNFIDTSTKGA
ncbi:hypothetical protein COMNV_00589 [Commensalibacter sp. Nvir]|uniref:structural cement protein Gp24 n=1 Tax=Commensalibacter sp. Nvir TaxID=3069817 RepID=UPI002D4BEB48|nr:hypothetical protein COMNV_00589 [Commensalibacter sp. Nvir]